MLKLRFKNNKHNAVWLVEPKVTLGRSATNDLVVDDAGVAERHVEILVEYEKLTLVNVSGGQPVFINNTEVSDRSALQTNDVITLGKVQLQVVDPKQEPKAGPTVVRRGEDTSGWSLKANHSALANRVFPLKEATIVGRSNECDINLAAAHLSRRHARLEVRDGLLYVIDLGSSNGTFLNGRRITEARVKRGDELRFDTLSFGVIGPADDLDKTTIRSVQAMPLPKARPAMQAKVRQQRPPPARKPAMAGAARGMQHTPSSAPAAASAQKTSGGNGLMILGIVLLVVAAVGWYVYQQGML